MPQLSPQNAVLNKYGLLKPLQSLLLAQMGSDALSSHELKHAILHHPDYNRLTSLIKNYPPSGFAEPASFIGAACGDLAKNGYCQQLIKWCPYKKSREAAFRIIRQGDKCHD